MAPRSPIIYFKYQDIFGPAYDFVMKNASEHAEEMVESWSGTCLGKPLMIGDLVVGRVSDIQIDKRNEQVGLVIEWSSHLQIATRL